MKYTDNGIVFNNVKDIQKIAGIRSDLRYSAADYNYDTSDNPIAPNFLINVIDVDWNGANVNGTTVDTTGQLLKIIADLQTKVGQLESAFSTLAQNVGALVTITNGDQT